MQRVKPNVKVTPKPAEPLRWSPLQPGEEALTRVRENDNLPEPVKA